VNPYKPPHNTPHHNTLRLQEWLAIALLIGLASHGAVKILETCGVIVWHEGSYYLWFESQLKKLMH